MDIQVGAFRRELAALDQVTCQGLRALAAETSHVLRFTSIPFAINIVGRVRAVTFDRRKVRERGVGVHRILHLTGIVQAFHCWLLHGCLLPILPPVNAFSPFP